MKKRICILLSLLLVLALAACKPPVDGPDMEYHDPTANDPTTNTPTANDPTDAPDDPGDDPGVPADTEDPTEPVEPEVPMDPEVSADDWPLEVYAGLYRLDDASGEEMHCIEVFDLGNMLVLEHGLYMDGSLYSFWVEEFWPDDQVEWNDLYDPMPGMSQTFSIMTSDTQYDDAPHTCSLRYHDSGIAISRGEDVIEYYVMDEQIVSIHTNTESFQSQLAGSGAPGGEAADRWYSWNGYTFILAEFNLDGSFRWICKEMATPIQVYQGAWTNEDGRIVTLSERLGAGGYPYYIEMNWEYSGKEGYLCLQEEEPLLLECYGGTDYFYPMGIDVLIPFYQGEALEIGAVG